MRYEEIQGDLIKLALEGNFDVIAHGCNCEVLTDLRDDIINNQ